MSELFLRKYPVCGKEFVSTRSNRKYCSGSCYDKATNQMTVQRQRFQRALKKPKVKKPVGKPLEQWMREAEACGMDYGTYRTQVERLGRTFEELSANSRRPQVHSHFTAL